MIRLLKKYNKWNETLLLGVASIMCFGLTIFRSRYPDSPKILLLNWDLFLAFIPWAISSIAVVFPKLQDRKLIILFLFATWLLFFPNAPYLLTDLLYLRIYSRFPQWFDLVMILCFAWTGLLFGFLSLMDMEKVLLKSVNRTWTSTIVAGILFLSSFGIYIGKYLGWNSWDIIRNPFGVFYDIGERVMNPFEFRGTWAFTIIMGIFLNIVYWSFRLIKQKR